MTTEWWRFPSVSVFTARIRQAKRLSAPRWMAFAPVEMTDAEAARFGRQTHRREAEVLLEFVRAGGGAIVHR